MKIVVERLEGLTELCVKKEFNSFMESHLWLISQSDTFPKTGGYDKHRFEINFDDDISYEGRLDCKHYDCSDSDLNIKLHIEDFCFWVLRHNDHQICTEENKNEATRLLLLLRKEI